MGLRNLAMWFANFAMRNFAKVLMFYVRQMNSVLALRNCIAKLALRNGNGLRIAQYPAATVPLVLHPAASHPVFNCISFSSLFL